jgi:hypothetical protein
LSFIPKFLSEEAEPFFELLWFAKVDWFCRRSLPALMLAIGVSGKVAGGLPIDLT